MSKTADTLHNERIEGWEQASFEDIADIGAGNPAPQGEQFFKDGVFPFVRVQDMGRLGENKHIINTADRINQHAIEKMKLFPKGTVLFTKSGASSLLNQRAILKTDMYVVSHIATAMPFNGILSDHLYYWLKTSDFNHISINICQLKMLLSFMKEVAQMPVIEYNQETGEVMPEHQSHYDRITSFIWQTIYNLPIGRFLRAVLPIGQTQKKEDMEAICNQFGVPKGKMMYVGDSQTDVQCVEFLRGCGLTMTFNGKGRVCRISDIMYIGEDARAIEEVAVRFAELGREDTIRSYSSPEADCGGLLAAVPSEHIKVLHEQSVKKRKEFRGVHIGELT